LPSSSIDAERAVAYNNTVFPEKLIMSNTPIRGVQANQEVDSRVRVKDLRSNGEKFRDWIERGDGLWIVGMSGLAAMFVFPAIMEITALFLALFLWWAKSRPFTLPFRLPMHAGMKDPNDPAPGSYAPGRPAGIAFLGNDRVTQQELWFNNSDMRTHLLVFGSTGAGKALPNHACALSVDGWKEMGALQKGDKLLRPDGGHVQINEVFPQGELALWRITLEDGREIECSPDHLWTVFKHHHELIMGRPGNDEDREAMEPGGVDVNWGAWDEAQTITTADLQYQLMMRGHEHPEGLAIPLPLGIEAPTWVSSFQAGDMVKAAINSLNNDGEIFPWPAGQGSLRQRQQFWDELSDGAGEHWMGRSEFLVKNEQAAQELLKFAWAMGWWASLDNAGLDKAGLDKAGLDKAGLDKAGLDKAGLDKAGLDKAGLDKAGLDNAGLDNAGLDNAGLDNAGSGWMQAEGRHNQGIENVRRVLTIMREAVGVRIKTVEKTNKLAQCTCIELAGDAKTKPGASGLFITDNYVVTHNTEVLLSMAFNSLVHGSGFIYVDGKGDSSLFTKIFSMARSVGREDDLLVVNFMLAKDLFGPQSVKLSNTMNPFANGSAGGLTELLVSLMDDAGGDGAMWKGRAISLISSIMFALVYLREFDGQLLGVGDIRNYLILENIQALSKRRDLPDVANKAINAYLHSLPGYQPNAAKQSETALDQHGYLQMQFTRILGSLADTYGHIFNTNLGEVDFEDVVVNRRILAVLLPALGKSLDELSNLGKIIVTSIKQMMSAGLGDVLEGDFEDINESKPTANEPAAFTCIFDEYGYYVVKGASVILAQGRSLGFSIIVAGQDFPSFKKNNNAEEAAATIGNCNIKIFMKIEDPTDTFDLFDKSIGEAMVGSTTGLTKNTGGLSNVYSDQNNASIERRKRGDWLDLKDQREGEAHIIFKSTAVRAIMFFVNPKNPAKLRLNHFLRVKPPVASEMLDMDKTMANLRKTLLDDQLVQDHIQGTPMLPSSVRAALGVAETDGKKWIVQQAKGMAAAKRVGRAHLSTFEERTRQLSELDEAGSEFDNSIFSKELADYDEDEEDEDTEDADDEDDGIGIDADRLLESLASVGRAGGGTERDAKKAADASVEDLRIISSYPHSSPPPMDASEILDIIQRIDDGMDEFDHQDAAGGNDEEDEEDEDEGMDK
jgi:intracellular multiplication protein IcmO